jgi:hypothetical protein
MFYNLAKVNLSQAVIINQIFFAFKNICVFWAKNTEKKAKTAKTVYNLHYTQFFSYFSTTSFMIPYLRLCQVQEPPSLLQASCVHLPLQAHQTK